MITWGLKVRSPRGRWVPAALALVMATAFVALTGTAGGTTKKPQRGGTLTFANTISVNGMDPVNSFGAASASSDATYFSAAFDMLMTEDPRTGKVNPKIAKSLTSTDGLAWTLRLRDGIKFTDGTAYDAAAVKFNWERIADPANNSTQLGPAQTIASIVVVDALTLRISLKSANAQFPRVVAKNIPFVGSPTAIRSLGTKFATAPVGAGPFVFKDWIRDSAMTFSKNGSYWVKGRPFVDGLIIKYVPDGTQRYNAFAAGELDLAFVSGTLDLVPRAEAAGYKVQTLVVPGGQSISMNTAKPPFNDPVARQAMAYALDRKGFAETVNFGATPVLKNLYPSSHPFYDPTAKLPQFDPAKAQKLFDQYAAAHGGPLVFSFESSQSQEGTLKYFQAQFSQFKNVTMNIIISAPGVVVAHSLAGQFDTIIVSISLLDPEPDVTNYFSTGGGRNYTKYSNPEMDAAIKTGRESLDTATRAKAYKTVQRLLLRDVPLVFYRPVMQAYLIGSKARNLEFINGGLFLWDDIWLTKGGK